MNTNSSTWRSVAMLILALTAGMILQNVAVAQGRRGGGNRSASAQRGASSMKRGGSSTQRRSSMQRRPAGSSVQGKRALQQRGNQITRRPVQQRPPVRKPGNITRPAPRPQKPGGITRPAPRPQKPGGSIRPMPRPQKPGNGITKPGNGTIKPGQVRPRPFPKPNSGNHGSNGWKHKQRQKFFHGTHRQCFDRCLYVRGHRHLHWHYDLWCGYYPTHCHWWYNWCGSSYYFDPTCCVTYNWYYCPVRVVYQGVTQRYSWHLGINCVYIQGRGLGIQEVEEGSPADLAGLTAGMVILQADGQELTSDAVMPSVLEQSSGMLNLTVITDDTEQMYNFDVQMNRLASTGF